MPLACTRSQTRPDPDVLERGASLSDTPVEKAASRLRSCIFLPSEHKYSHHKISLCHFAVERPCRIHFLKAISYCTQERKAKTHRNDASDTTDDSSLNVGSAEMESTGSEESDWQPESKKRQEYISTEKITRKRPRRSDQCKIIDDRSLRPNKEDEYVARNGRTVRAKEMGPGCKESCRYKCHSRMTYEERFAVYIEFYRTAPTLGKQWEYVRQTVKKAPKRESTREESRRANTYSYSFPIKGEDRKVCKTMYLSTLRISNSVVETAFHKNGLISPSRQGEVPNTSERIPQDLKESIREHIDTLPRVTDGTYVLWLLKKEAAENSQADVLPLRGDQENDDDISSDDNSASGSDFRAQTRFGVPALIEDATDDLPLNVVSTEMTSDSDETLTQPVPEKQREYISQANITRKRPRRSEQSQASVRSQEPSKEDEHVSRSGKTGRVKEMGPGCKENCRSNCHSRVSFDERLEIYNDFYRTAPTLEQQWEYICRTVKKAPKKESTREESRRANTYSYSFRIKEETRKVCKTMYLSTLQVSNSIVETAFQKLRENGTISPSKRGKVSLSSTSSRRIPQDLKDSVREHINTFPRVPSHCCGKETTQEYLQEGMSVAKMHRMYVLWMLKKKAAANLPTENLPISAEQGNSHDISSEDNAAGESDLQYQFRSVDPSLIDGKVIATERQYRDLFDNEFNLAFFSKKNQCDECVVFKRATAEQKHWLDDTKSEKKH